ncbi:MAG TPA: hypothetical protein VFQ36_04735, partial [Ktedonobacteraceae bacterium]|nr:hypothetical protein [Ktedonobacteraceae bacterium]
SLVGTVQILRCAQDDRPGGGSQDEATDDSLNTTQILLQEVFSPNACLDTRRIDCAALYTYDRRFGLMLN